MFASINQIDLGRKKPQHVSVAIAEINSFPSHWVRRENLHFLDNQEIVITQVREILASIAAFNKENPNDRVTVVVFPELSVPESFQLHIVTWSKEQDAIVVAGSHYQQGKERSNRCPVVISGNIYYVEKINPAPSEKSPVGGECLTHGDELTIFNNTQAGNFSVMICSDFLEPALRSQILDLNLDLLCVAAFQSQSSLFHERMNIAVQDAPKGLYIAYSNMQCETFGDGRSACFGLTHTLFHDMLVSHSFTTSLTPTKLFELPYIYNYAILRLDIENKRPYVPLKIATDPNIQVILGRTNQHKTFLSVKPISQQTLSHFVKTDHLCKHIDAKGATNTNRQVVFAENFIQSYIPRFKFAKIDSIGQLLIELEAHKELLVLFISEWFKTEDGRRLSHVPAGFCVSLLCTMRVMNQGSPEGLLAYWENVIFNKDVGPKRISEQMCIAFESARNALGAK